MKRLNNKAMTTVEIIVCFVLVAIIATTMLNVVLNYKTREEIESINADVIRYKNTVTRIIQNDIVMKHLESVSITEGENSNYNYKRVRLTFTKEITSGVKAKTLTIYSSRGLADGIVDYITYQDENNNPIRYNLSNLGGYRDTSGFNDRYYQHLRFGSVSVISKFDCLIIDIPIYHHELGSKNHISIKAPINQ